ncbi:sodium:calcium antiporter [uncultured Jannaschia sp.]|uniref:sodium:calcium antiporter n=1 Tax=uncultured Jannaschia sp. TaxID=293347 RepID=UPI00260D5162|nr:sodium:calcium antiporter [uncultured Jannaschia sp.]
MIDFTALPILANLGIFAAAACAVWFAGTRLAGYADEIAELTGIGSAAVGMILLAGITSLPEIAVSVSAGFTGSAALAVNNLLGSIALQVVVLAIGDWVLGGRALSFVIGNPVVLLQGIFGALLMAALAGAVGVGDVAFLGAGVWSLGLAAAAVGLMWFAAREANRGELGWTPANMPDLGDVTGEGEPPDTLKKALLLTGAMAAIILVAGFLLSQTGDALAQQTGLGQSFMGLTLVGLATSLPEVSTLVAAVRLKRYTMAFGDIFGTNILNVALIWLIDLAYPGGPVLLEVGPFSQVAAVLGAILTLLYVAGLIERRDETLGRLGLDSWAVIAVYLGGLGLLFTLR